MYFRQVSDCAAYTDDGNRRLGKPGNRLKFTFYVGADMFYFRCRKETGRLKFFRQTDSTYGNTDRMQLLFVFYQGYFYTGAA